MKEQERRCGTCEWYDEWIGVCFNGESEHKADFLDKDKSCEKWEEKKNGKEKETD